MKWNSSFTLQQETESNKMKYETTQKDGKLYAYVPIEQLEELQNKANKIDKLQSIRLGKSYHG